MNPIECQNDTGPGGEIGVAAAAFCTSDAAVERVAMLEAAVALVEMVPTDALAAVEIEARVAASNIASAPSLDSLVGDHSAVEQLYYPIGVRRYVLLMSYHDQRIALGV